MAMGAVSPDVNAVQGPICAALGLGCLGLSCSDGVVGVVTSLVEIDSRSPSSESESHSAWVLCDRTTEGREVEGRGDSSSSSKDGINERVSCSDVEIAVELRTDRTSRMVPTVDWD